MSARLPSGLLVSALLRRVNDSGGIGAVLAKGDAQGGGILILLSDRTDVPRAIERGIGRDGETALIEATRGDDLDSYWRRRRARDPDLWVIELDSPDSERFAAETILTH